MTAVAERELREKQIQQAEELLFSGVQRAGFAKDLYFGRFRSDAIFPYPHFSDEEQRSGDEAVEAVKRFCRDSIDADRIDRDEDIPPSVIRGLADLGVLGMCVSPKYGGRGFSQQSYCRVLEVIGSHCASTAVFVNAHHSIGLRALELFGTPEQKSRWMQPLANGETLAAFALTEPEAGSDAGNVQTRATPTADGRGYTLNGRKHYITNASIAGVLTVMARTPDSKDPDGKVTAFLVTPDMPGFTMVTPRMEKCGIRGTATGRFDLKDVFVPKENVLGAVGKGLRLALTVLDFGRTTFGATCTGSAKYCMARLAERANARHQFGKSLGDFELVKQKLALAAADTFAMESMTYYTAALIDSGAEDYMLETAMLKVFASDNLWRIVNDTLQVWGGAGFFTDQPFERMMRDSRLNLIGEGANDVLRCFIAMVGLRNLGKEMESILKRPWKAFSLLRFAPHIPSKHGLLHPAAGRLSKQIAAFGRACIRALVKYREGILDRQYVQARLGDVASELLAASCVYARLASIFDDHRVDETLRQQQVTTGLYYLKLADSRNRQRLRELTENDDADCNQTADAWLKHPPLPIVPV